ncbi:hypothetical protein JHK84_047001 [Glycine max]|nr:hypothetical protein JHK85_047562 [Glycine max]KAG5102032.1 hypothetical protein JHK84_047001 [Glycine max]
MISGLAMNGYGREAIESFEEMLRIGIRPDDQTLTAYYVNGGEARLHNVEDLAWCLQNSWPCYTCWGHWEKVAEVRKLMKNKSIQTTPGCSTIELKGVVHEFVVDDVSHTRNHEIYETLDEINHQLRIAGYVVELSSELHKMDDKEKGYVLSHHSEKLAIAFGVLATPPGTTLRVANNLRICVDCFNFLKHFSGVYNGDVILRDHNRFHHFRGGCCSCSNYW